MNDAHFDNLKFYTFSFYPRQMSFVIKRKAPTFLLGGGEMGERIRNFDWENTPLGNPGDWPQSLKTCVRIMLTSRQPIWIGWGKELIKLYNDPYRSIVGGKHPDALGKPASVVWSDIWNDIEPMLKTVMEKDEGTYVESQLLIMDRNGYPEETYYTFSYTPIPDDNGITAGVFCANTDDTSRVINERALETLRNLGKISFKGKKETQIFTKTATILAENNKDFPYACFYKIKGDEAKMVAWAGDKTSYQPFPQSINIKQPDTETQNICKAINNNENVISSNNGRRPNIPKGFWDIVPEQILHIPLCISNNDSPNAVLTLGLNPYRKYDSVYQSFIQLLTDQILLEMNNLHSMEEDRKRVEALAEIDKAKTVFFNNISHEFRTPLALMLSPLEEALNEKEMIPLNQMRLTIAHRNAMRLLKLVNTLLDFSRIESGRQEAHFTEVNIAAFTKNLASNFQSVIEKAGLEFIVNTQDIQEPVFVDKEMWEKIVLNLLSNAFKYTLEGRITVNLFAEKNWVVLEVSDTGVGIAENEIPKMFQRFHRVKGNPGRSHEGSGIGLSLVKELVRFHSGTIKVKSENGKGSSFTITIPTGKEHISQEQLISVKRELEEAISNFYTIEAGSFLEPGNGHTSVLPEDINEIKIDHEPSAHLNGKSHPKISTVLIADDNADMRDYLETLLQKTYKVVVAKNGKEALEKIHSQKVDLVLSDIMMPVMDGIQLLKEVKNNQQTARVPVILLSARAGEEAKIEGYDIGADDYLVKPFSAKELLARVRAHLKMVKVRNEVEGNVRNLFMEAPAIICVLRGPQHVFELANEMYLKLVGHRDIVGKPIRDALSELEGTGIYEILDEVFKTGKPFIANEFAVKLEKGNGKLEESIFNFIYQPSYNADDEIEGILVHAIDVTEQVIARKKIEESEKKYRLLFNSIDEGFCIIEVLFDGNEIPFDYRFLEANEAFEKQTGLRNVVGKTMKELAPQHEQYWFDIYGRIAKTRQPERFENEAKALGFYYEVYAFPFAESEENRIGILFKDISERKQAETALLETRQQLSAELADTKKLQRISTELIQEDNVTTLYEQIIAAAIDLMKSDMASIQMFHSETNQLQLLSWKGFHPESAAHWEWLNADSKSSCGMALKNHERMVVPDVDEDKLMAGTKDLYYYQLSGITAVQSTPLVSRSGNVVGMISTHWRQPHQPSERDLQLFDVLARQAADLIERRKAEQKLEESERRFRNLAESLPQLIWMTDEKGIREFVSKKWEDYTGIPPQMIDEKWASIVHPEDFENISNLWMKSVATGEVYKGELRMKNKAGQYRWHSVIGEPIFDNENRIVKWVGAFTDIHFMKREQIRKDAFLSMASHELKTPVTTIKAYSEIAEIMLEQKGDVQTLAIQKKLGRQVNKLATLIKDLLDNIRVEKGKLIYTESFYNFNNLVQEIVDDMQKINPDHKIQFQGGEKVKVFGDADKIGQVLNNLITNAVKYSPGTEEIIINTELQKDGVQLSVKDFGIGISDEDQPHVFEQFYRVNGDSQSTFPGMGVGLYICEEIVKRQGGKIWVESAIGNGSTFYVWLPFNHISEAKS
jgi:PAS domain S-box-containing protein